MRGGALLIVAVGTTLLSGCAGPQHVRQLKQFRVDLDAMHQRISGLERTQFEQASRGLSLGEEAAGGYVEPSIAEAASGASASPATQDIQRALNNAGFYQGAIDGKRGPLTRAAIKEFQRTHGLKVDGKAGPQTWSQLQPYLDLEGGGAGASAPAILK